MRMTAQASQWRPRPRPAFCLSLLANRSSVIHSRRSKVKSLGEERRNSPSPLYSSIYASVSIREGRNEACKLQPDIFFLKHESGIFRSDQSYSPVCGFSMMEQVRLSTVSPTVAWHFQDHIQGLMNDLNMLLSCFRVKMPGYNLGWPSSDSSR